jgi:hypothetical protein
MRIDIGSGRGTPASPAPGTPSIDAIPASPPPEVDDAIAVAAGVYENLKTRGREVRFNLDEATGRLVVAVHDLEGNFLFSVPPSKALDLAAGGSLH